MSYPAFVRSLYVVVAFNLCHGLGAESLQYPKVPRESKYVDDYFGVKVTDHYRSLENPDLFGTKKFVRDQKRLFQEFIDEIPERKILDSALYEVWDYPTFYAPAKHGEFYFFVANNGTQNQDVLYMKTELTAEAETVLDANLESENGTVSFTDYAVSWDGTMVAYSVSDGGSDWKKLRIRNITSGEDLPEEIERVKFPSYAWTKDNQGLFYPRYPSDKDGKVSSQNRKVYYHRLNTSVSDDILISEFPGYPTWLQDVDVSTCGKYAIMAVYEDYEPNAFYLAPLRNMTVFEGFNSTFVPIIPSVNDAKYEYVTNIGTKFIFLSTKNASNSRVISINVGQLPEEATSNETGVDAIVSREKYPIESLVDEDPQRTLSWVDVVANKYLLLCYLSGVLNTVEMVHLNDTMGKRYMLPVEPGTFSHSGASNENETEFFIRYESYVTPGMVYRCDLKTGDFECDVIAKTPFYTMNLSDFTFKQVFYPSYDGTAVPMFIISHKNFTPDGTAPAVLRGYGGYAVSSLPHFSISKLFFVLAFKGIYAVANIRGGGEYGKSWHEDGRLDKKQNTFDDFQAAAEYLIAENYTNSRKLAISGSSNGGLLVATCVNQRPDLYAAANVDVGVLDMLRFQKFTGGFHWCPEYGCSDNEKEFKTLIKYSPLHNIKMPKDKSSQYPAVLVTTADRDDRVVPSHSFKYVAELQYTIGSDPKQTNPLLLRVETDAGHGEGNSNSKEFDRIIDVMTFYTRTMNLTLHLPQKSTLSSDDTTT